MISKHSLPFTLIISLLALANFSQYARGDQSCEMIAENLCLDSGVDLSRMKDSPQILEAAKAYALKMKDYGVIHVTSGYRSAKQQRSKRRSGVQAGPSSGRNMSAHIYGTAIDLQIKGDNKFRKPTCEALISVMPIIGRGGGVIHEGCGGGSCDVHIDDNWGKRHWDGKTIMYASHGNCEDFPVLKKVRNSDSVALVIDPSKAVDSKIAVVDEGDDDDEPAKKVEEKKKDPEPQAVAKVEDKGAEENCNLVAENLCLSSKADLSRVEKSPEVIDAAKVFAEKMKPFGLVYITSGYLSPKEGKRRRDGHGGPWTGSRKNPHIYGTAIDLHVVGNKNLRGPSCEALLAAMSTLGKGGGVSHEGCGGGSCDVHIDDNWGKRHFGGKTVLYDGVDKCEGFAPLKKVRGKIGTALTLQKDE